KQYYTDRFQFYRLAFLQRPRAIAKSQVAVPVRSPHITYNNARRLDAVGRLDDSYLATDSDFQKARVVRWTHSHSGPPVDLKQSTVTRLAINGRLTIALAHQFRALDAKVPNMKTRGLFPGSFIQPRSLCVVALPRGKKTPLLALGIVEALYRYSSARHECLPESKDVAALSYVSLRIGIAPPGLNYFNTLSFPSKSVLFAHVPSEQILYVMQGASVKAGDMEGTWVLNSGATGWERWAAVSGKIRGIAETMKEQGILRFNLPNLE
ncbi:hypothetical protein P7C70_g9096, partial [Phenoliferia sp. Uapishka_3]